jgi:predicted enzyme related to lactoylglutathione lyase
MRSEPPPLAWDSRAVRGAAGDRPCGRPVEPGRGQAAPAGGTRRGPGGAHLDARYIGPMPGLRVCIDVDDLDHGLAFYTRALGLTVGRRDPEGAWAELLGAPTPLDILAKPPGTAALPRGTRALRDYERHWTPVHLDFVVEDLAAAVRRAVDAGAKVERDAETKPWGAIAILSDPFGHGFCLLEMKGRGYDEVLSTP